MVFNSTQFVKNLLVRIRKRWIFGYSTMKEWSTMTHIQFSWELLRLIRNTLYKESLIIMYLRTNCIIRKILFIISLSKGIIVFIIFSNVGSHTGFPRIYLVFASVEKHVHPLCCWVYARFASFRPMPGWNLGLSRIFWEISSMDKLKNGEFLENISAVTCNPFI